MTSTASLPIAEAAATTVVFMLPGQGSQFVGMGAFLYESDSAFRSAFDEFLHAYGPGAAELRRVWLHGTRDDMARGAAAQPLLFAVGYATGRLLLERVGDAPSVLIGHSVGELAAAVLAGVFDVEIAGELLRVRADLLSRAPAGGMIACRAPREAVEACLASVGQAAVIGAENAVDQCVVSAAASALEELISGLRSAGIACMRVAATEPFHSPLLAGAAERLGDVLYRHRDRIRPPGRALVSAYSGDWVTASVTGDPRFWTRQMAEPVQFRRALSRVDRAGALYVEAGPGLMLSGAARGLAHVRDGRSRTLAAMPSRTGEAVAWQTALDAVAEHAESAFGAQTSGRRR
ncbi:acyltransferase domain-containing protein [Amycolatopsis sp. cmx-4-83]|uniref:acyltransferase domain-containing protein n=1 Tax=Amycolatopsis sp. cmx-4-83 TaxID=2790940 RepID=UPI003978EB26